jgi:hypothetical protein
MGTKEFERINSIVQPDTARAREVAVKALFARFAGRREFVRRRRRQQMPGALRRTNPSNCMSPAKVRERATLQIQPQAVRYI